MSKRAKFTLITWIGENVSGLQRAKISTDKTLVKDVCQVRPRSAHCHVLGVVYLNSHHWHVYSFSLNVKVPDINPVFVLCRTLLKSSW